MSLMPNFAQEDYQVAFVFDPEQDEIEKQHTRPAKRRKGSKKDRESSGKGDRQRFRFQSLFGGEEKNECVKRREALFEEHWGQVDGRIKDVLRNSNNTTLREVTEFVSHAQANCVDQIPCALIITGPNIASQDLLFSQLSNSLTNSTTSRYVRLLSSECTNLEATLKKVIRDATTIQVKDDDDDDDEIAGAEGRRYLDYDLEALHAHVEANRCEHVFVAFQDSEGFDSGLLSELVQLLYSWRPRIPFTLLFGIATSVDLLQARLLKSACSLIYGAQFDVEQTETILETVFKAAIANITVSLQLGPHVLKEMLDRQHDQVAGVQAFASSLKYAYMCHFYANPLSILTSATGDECKLIHSEHLESLRNLPSFQHCVEEMVEQGDAGLLQKARGLLENDQVLRDEIAVIRSGQRAWRSQLLRVLAIFKAAGAQPGTYSNTYVGAMGHGVQLSEDSNVVACVRRMNDEELASFLARVMEIVQEEEQDTGGEGFLRLVRQVNDQLIRLQEGTDASGRRLRSKYSGQSKIMRTTVIAQRVQLSQDHAALRDEDNEFTDIVDNVTGLLVSKLRVAPLSQVLFSEAWVYDSKWPIREVFIPRPRIAFERSLSRPHDYLACSCCKGEEGGGGEGGGGGGGGGEAGEMVRATFPTTSILYHLYKETGSLINVADLWSAFYNLVGDQVGQDERRALVLFYRGLAELRSMGYVKSSRKKTDHVAKVKWL